MSDKPGYLGRLDAVAVAEERDGDRLLMSEHERMQTSAAPPADEVPVSSLDVRLDRLQAQTGRLRDFVAHGEPR